MFSIVSRRFVLSGLGAITAAGAVYGGAPATSLRPQARGSDAPRRADAGAGALIKAAGLSGAVACAVADINTGRQLETVQGKMGLPPASVAKALTTLYALEVLGAKYRFTTRIMATGPLRNGILHGDLILAGGGDPTLTTDDLAAMAAELKTAGIREVRGNFQVYDGALPFVHSIDAQQPDQLGYSPAVSGIALNFNRVHFEWKRGSKGYAVTMDARTTRYRPAVHMAKMKVIKRRTPVYTYKDRNGVDQWTVASMALGNNGARWLPVRKPAAYVADVFQTLARAHGVVLKKPKFDRKLPGDARVLVQHHSAELRVIIKGMLKYSNNLTAEMVGMTASAARGRKPASLKASAAEMSRWASDRFGMTGTKMVDHSGLGDASRMTPEDLVGALVQVRKRGILKPLLKPFVMRDAKGRVYKNHPIKVNAKTGTLNFVSGLAGYMTAADGTEMAFAIFTADTAIRARIKRADREVPQGARTWNRKSKKLQQKLIERWGALYG